MAEASVLFCTQGTYPFSGGGVSTWCDILCQRLPQIDYILYAITGDARAKPRYTLPPNVTGVIQVPLWGFQDEYYLAHLPAVVVRVRKRATTRAAIEAEFVPLFRRFLRGIVEPTAAHVPGVGRAVYRLWRYFQRYDWETTWKAEPTWNSFVQEIMRPYRDGEPYVYPDETPTLLDLANALRSLHHYLLPLTMPVPRTDLVHTTVAGFPGFAGIIAKFAYRTPFLITEHGVFIREQYLAISSENTFSLFMKRFMINLSNLVCRLNYHYADVISTVADFNRRWQVRYGVDIQKTRVIYNGIDPAVFVPRPKPLLTANRPTAVAATRVIPIKDIETMIRSAAVARDSIPDVLYIIFGSLEDEPAYVEKCRKLVAELELENNFMLYGHHSNPREIYTFGDIGILSSISEGIPYAMLESMACERPFVSTDVGGVSEALQGCGLMVPPHRPDELGQAAVTLLTNDQLRLDLGRKSRQKVLSHFHISKSVDAYLELYRQLIAEAVPSSTGQNSPEATS